MSTATEIARLSAARNTIRDKLVNFGLAESTDKLDELATVIDGIANRGAVSAQVQEGDTYTIPAGYHNGAGTVSGVSGGGNYTLQSKGPITPTKSQISVTPDSGYYGLSDVTIGAIPEAYQNVSAVTATAGDVLSPKVIVAADGTTLTGTMPNNGAVSKVLDASTSSGTPTNNSYTVPAGYHNGSGTVSIVLETKSATPTKSTQNITPTAGKVLSKVTVNAIPAAYQDVSNVTATASDVLAGAVFVDSTGAEIAGTIAAKTSSDLTVSGATVTAPAGFYGADASATIDNGTLSASATGSATISSLTPTYNSSNDEFDITGSASISGTATASVSTAGYVGTSTTGTGSATGTASVSAALPVIAGSTTITGTKKVTPVISRTTTTATGAVNVGSGTASTTKPSSGYFVSVKSAANTGTLTATPSVTSAGYGNADHNDIAGNTETVGANASAETYITVPGGSATTPETTITTDPTITVSSSGLITASYSGSQSVTPTVSAGYITSGTAGTISTSGSKTQQLTVQAAATYYPSTTAQTITSGKYLTGTQTIAAVALSGISAANIKYGATVKVGDSADDDRITSVTGTFTGSSTVSSGQTAAAAGQILAGYSAWVNGEEVEGSIVSNGAISGSINGLTTTSYSIPAGYTTGGSVSLTNDIELALAAI